jgi:hypothetical protein
VLCAAAGRSVGVAKEARVVAVRVLDCAGAGSVSNVVAGKLTATVDLCKWSSGQLSATRPYCE